jgi:putative hemolysin
MIPRTEIVALDATLPLDANLETMAQHEHSRYPVIRGGWHDVIGIVRTRTVLARMVRQQPPDLPTAAAPAMYVPETVSGMELLESFRTSGQQEALVVDEYGEVLGLVTLRDLIEGITGEFHTSDSHDSWAVQRDDGSWLLDGTIPIPEMKDRLRIKAVPEEERERYHTVSGMLLLLLGRVPRTGDHADWEDWRFEVVDMDGNRIDKVLATKVR